MDITNVIAQLATSLPPDAAAAAGTGDAAGEFGTLLAEAQGAGQAGTDKAPVTDSGPPRAQTGEDETTQADVKAETPTDALAALMAQQVQVMPLDGETPLAGTDTLAPQVEEILPSAPQMETAPAPQPDEALAALPDIELAGAQAQQTQADDGLQLVYHPDKLSVGSPEPTVWFEEYTPTLGEVAPKAAQTELDPLFSLEIEKANALAKAPNAEAKPLEDGGRWLPEGMDAVAFVAKQAAPGTSFALPEALDVEQPQFAQQLAETVVQKAEAGVQQFDIALYPKELGKVTVNVQIEAGQAVISLVCESAKSQSILNAHAGAIGTLVEQSTGRQAVVEVPQQNADDAQDAYDGHNGGEQRQRQNDQKGPKQEQVGFFIDQLKSSMLVG